MPASAGIFFHDIGFRAGHGAVCRTLGRLVSLDWFDALSVEVWSLF